MASANPSHLRSRLWNSSLICNLQLRCSSKCQKNICFGELEWEESRKRGADKDKGRQNRQMKILTCPSRGLIISAGLHLPLFPPFIHSRNSHLHPYRNFITSPRPRAWLIFKVFIFLKNGRINFLQGLFRLFLLIFLKTPQIKYIHKFIK